MSGVDVDYSAVGIAERAAELRALRATTAEQERALRLKRAVDTLRALGFREMVIMLETLTGRDAECMQAALRDDVAAERRRLTDGSDEPRYAATGAALDALGALWCCS